MPLNRDAPLLDRRHLGGAYFLLTFGHAEVARDARPGQFVMIKAGMTADLPLRRPFPVMARDAPSGPGRARRAPLGPGEPAQCLGPLGRPFEPPAAGEEALMVAGGYGVSPF